MYNNTLVIIQTKSSASYCAGTDLDRSGVSLEPDDLSDQFLVAHSHELVHSSSGHALGDNHCEGPRQANMGSTSRAAAAAAISGDERTPLVLWCLVSDRGFWGTKLKNRCRCRQERVWSNTHSSTPQALVVVPQTRSKRASTSKWSLRQLDRSSNPLCCAS